MKYPFFLIILICNGIGFSSCSERFSRVNSATTTSNFEEKTAVPSIAQVVNYAEPIEFYFGLGSRFTPISKEEIVRYTEVKNFLGEEEFKRQTQVEATALIVIQNEKQTDIRYSGDSELLSKEQLSALRNATYGSNFCLKTFFVPRSDEQKDRGYHIYNPHFTISPHKRAEFALGDQAIFDYLRAAIKEDLTDYSENDLSPAMLYFTISEYGALESYRLEGSCGAEILDQKIMDALIALPNKWSPAENENGERLTQELVLSYGLMGC